MTLRRIWANLWKDVRFFACMSLKWYNNIIYFSILPIYQAGFHCWLNTTVDCGYGIWMTKIYYFPNSRQPSNPLHVYLITYMRSFCLSLRACKPFPIKEWWCTAVFLLTKSFFYYYHYQMLMGRSALVCCSEARVLVYCTQALFRLLIICAPLPEVRTFCVTVCLYL